MYPRRNKASSVAPDPAERIGSEDTDAVAATGDAVDTVDKPRGQDRQGRDGPPAPSVESASDRAPAGKKNKIARRKKWRWIKSPSPVAVLARALSPRSDAAKPRPPDPPQGDVNRAPDRAGFWRVWLSHQDYLHRQSLRFSSGNAADAEDALSEAMLKAAQSFPKTIIQNPRAWLVRLVHNACMDRYRTNQRHSRLIKTAANDEQGLPSAVVPQAGRSPEEILSSLQFVGELQRALGGLPRPLAEPLLLYLDDWSDGDIAGALNVTREVVRKRRQMAREWLRRRLLW